MQIFKYFFNRNYTQFAKLIMRLLKEKFNLNAVSQENVLDIFSLMSDKPYFNNLSKIFNNIP